MTFSPSLLKHTPSDPQPGTCQVQVLGHLQSRDPRPSPGCPQPNTKVLAPSRGKTRQCSGQDGIQRMPPGAGDAHSFSRYFWSTYQVPGTAQGTANCPGMRLCICLPMHGEIVLVNVLRSVPASPSLLNIGKTPKCITVTSPCCLRPGLPRRQSWRPGLVCGDLFWGVVHGAGVGTREVGGAGQEPAGLG